MKNLVLLVLLTLSTGSAVMAQTSPAAEGRLDAALTPGTTAWITDAGGREEKTRIIGLSGQVLTVAAGDGTRRFRTADITRVRVRRSDSVLNGALIGAGVAVASGLFLCRMMEPWENCRDDVGPMVRIGAVGAGVGIGIDALIRGRKTVYQTGGKSIGLAAAPLLSRQSTGLAVSISF